MLFWAVRRGKLSPLLSLLLLLMLFWDVRRGKLSPLLSLLLLLMLFWAVRRGKLSPLLSLLLLLMLKLTHGCTMVTVATMDLAMDTTEDTDLDTPDTDLDILFGDVRRGPLRLSPLLRPKPIPGTTMVLATMVDS